MKRKLLLATLLLLCGYFVLNNEYRLTLDKSEANQFYSWTNSNKLPQESGSSQLRRKPQAWNVCDQIRTFSDTVFEYYSGVHIGSQQIGSLVKNKNQVRMFSDPSQKDVVIDELILPSHLNRVLRIGDGEIAGGYAGVAKLKFTVRDSFLTIHHRVVFQDPSHRLNQQPFAGIKIRDQFGLPVGCSDFLFVSQDGLPGFSSRENGRIKFSDWRALRLNLSAYLNQLITIEMTAGDCSLGGHYGYMYVAVECGASPRVYPKLALNLIKGDSILDGCSGNSAELEAVDGYVWYLWSNGSTNKKILVSEPGIYTLIAADSSGCQHKDQFVFSPTLSSLDVEPKQFCENTVVNIGLINYQTPYDKIDSVEWSAVINGFPLKISGGPETKFTAESKTSFMLTAKIKTQYGCNFQVTNLIRRLNSNEDIPSKIHINVSQTCLGSKTRFTVPESFIFSDWDFNNDGIYDVKGETDVFHQFPALGQYNVKYRISSDFGCYRDTLISINITQKPNLDFNYQDICIGEQPLFWIYRSTIEEKKITKMEWDYSAADGIYFNNYDDVDLTGVVKPNIFRDFRIPMLYQVSLRAYTNPSCFDTTTKPFYVHPFHYGGLKGTKFVCKDDLVAKFWLDKSNLYDTGSRVIEWQPVLSRHGLIERIDGDTVYFRCFPNNKEVMLRATIQTEFGCTSEKFISAFLIESKVSQNPQGPSFVCADRPEAEYFVKHERGREYFWQVENGQVVGRSDTAKVRVRWHNAGVGRIWLERSQSEDTLCFRASEKLEVSIAEKKDSLLAIEAVGMNPPFGLRLDWKTEGEDKDGKLLIKRNKQNLTLTDKVPTFFQDTAQNQIYYYQVASYNPCGDTVWSAVHRNIWLSARKVENQDSIYLSWNSYQNWPEGVREYQIWRAMDGQDFQLVGSTQDSSWSNHEGLLAFVHCFAVRAIGEQGLSSLSNQACVGFEHHLKANGIITPNADNKNDFFEIEKIERYPQNQLSIYNRWGQRVFGQENYQNNWAGTSQEGHQLEGTFFYIFSYITQEGKTLTISGAITVVR